MVDIKDLLEWCDNCNSCGAAALTYLGSGTLAMFRQLQLPEMVATFVTCLLIVLEW